MKRPGDTHAGGQGAAKAPGADASWTSTAGPAEALLEQGLQAARSRTGDELTRRRIWAHIAHPERRRFTPRGSGGRGWWLAVVGSGLVAASVSMWMLLGHVDGQSVPPQVAQEAAAQGGAAEGVAAEGGAAEESAPESQSEAFLMGPTVVDTNDHETMKLRLRGGARVSLASRSRLLIGSTHEAELKSGHASLEVTKQPAGQRFSVTAGPYQVVVVGTRFSLAVDAVSVGVQVQEGVVEVVRDDRRVRLQAGQSWTGHLQPLASVPARVARTRSPGASGAAAVPDVASPSAASEALAASPGEGAPAVATAPKSTAGPSPSSLAREAQAAVRAGEPDRALAVLQTLSLLPGPAAENAVYEMGRIWRDHKREPQRALKVWARYQREHPNGVLRPEVDLSVVETYVSLGQDRKAAQAAEAFVSRHPNSERRREVQRLLQLLQAKLTAP